MERIKQQIFCLDINQALEAEKYIKEHINKLKRQEFLFKQLEQINN
jgi:hypothetical protein